MNLWFLYNSDTKEWTILCESCRGIVDGALSLHIIAHLIGRADCSTGFAQCENCGVVVVYNG